MILRSVSLSLLLVFAAGLMYAAEADGPDTPLRGRDGGALGQTNLKRRKPKGIVIKPRGQGWYVGYSRGGSVMRDGWAPMHVIMTNNTKKIFTGILRCSVPDRRDNVDYTATYRQEISLAGRGTTKHFVMHIYIPKSRDVYTASSELRLKAEIVSKEHGILYPPDERDGRLPVNTLSRKAMIPIQNTLEEMLELQAFHVLFSENMFVGIPNRQILKPEVPGRPLRQVRHSQTQAYLDSLPGKWQGYSTAQTLFWDGLDLQPLEDPSRRPYRDAILEYVQAGGHLVIALGGSRTLVTNSLLGPLLPCRFGSVERRDLGKSLFGLENAPPALVTELLVPPDGPAPLVSDADGAPLAVRSDYGAGSVTVLAFSLSSKFLQTARSKRITLDKRYADARKKYHHFIRRIISRPTDVLQNCLVDQSLRVSAYNTLKREATKSIPGRAGIAAFLAIYLLVLVPLTYFLCRGWKRQELAWLATPLTAFLFFAGSYWWAFKDATTNLSVTQLAAIRLDETGRGTAQTFSLLYNPTYNSYNLQFQTPTVASSYLRLDKLPGVLTRDSSTVHFVEETRGIRIEDFVIDFNADRPMEALAPISVGNGLATTLVPAAQSGALPMNGVLGTVRNRLGMTLWSAAYIRGSEGRMLQTLYPTPDDQEMAIRENGSGSIPDIIARLCEDAGQAGASAFFQQALHVLAGGETRDAVIAVVRHSSIRWHAGRKDPAEIPSDNLGLVVIPQGPGAGPIRFPLPRYAPQDVDLYGYEINAER